MENKDKEIKSQNNYNKNEKITEEERKEIKTEQKEILSATSPSEEQPIKTSPEKTETEKGVSAEEIQVYQKKISELESQLQLKSKEAAEYYDKWLRALAELDNFRKRTEKEQKNWYLFAQDEVLADLLSVLDNFELALSSSSNDATNNAVLEGMRLIYKQLAELMFSKYKLSKIETVGTPFNPHVHEAISIIESNEYDTDVVVEEIRKGYMREDRVIRPALVKVAKPKLTSAAQGAEVELTDHISSDTNLLKSNEKEKPAEESNQKNQENKN